MKQSQWRRAYDPDPVHLEARVRHTLKNLDADPAARPHALRTALIAALVLALLAALYALTQRWLATRGVRRFESIR